MVEPVRGEDDDREIFVLEDTNLCPALKKRKRKKSAFKSSDNGKKKKSDPPTSKVKDVSDPNISDICSNHTTGKKTSNSVLGMRTLDEIFASMRKPTVSKPSHTLASPTKLQDLIVVDLTLPTPPSQNTVKLTNGGKNKSRKPASITRNKVENVRLKIASKTKQVKNSSVRERRNEGRSGKLLTAMTESTQAYRGSTSKKQRDVKSKCKVEPPIISSPRSPKEIHPLMRKRKLTSINGTPCVLKERKVKRIKRKGDEEEKTKIREKVMDRVVNQSNHSSENISIENISSSSEVSVSKMSFKSPRKIIDTDGVISIEENSNAEIVTRKRKNKKQSFQPKKSANKVTKAKTKDVKQKLVTKVEICQSMTEKSTKTIKRARQNAGKIISNPDDRVMKLSQISDKRQENYGLSPLPCKTELWTERYAPESSNKVLGNSASVERLKVWLKEWRERWEKEMDESVHYSRRDDSDSDFELDNEDKAELRRDNRDNFSKIAVLIGPCGCGKTAAVYACAKDLKFKVLEMNSSALRAGKQILSQLHEATLSHQVSKSSAFNFFKPKESNTERALDGDSLILLKDADIVFEQDRNFWSAVDTLVTDTKRPIILTSYDGDVMVNFNKKYEKINFSYPSWNKQFQIATRIIHNENCDVTENWSHDFKMTNALHSFDIRKTIHSLHFWGGGIPVNLHTAVTPSKSRKGRRRRSQLNTSLSEKPECYKLEDLSGKVAGIASFPPLLQINSTSTTVLSKSSIFQLCDDLRNPVFVESHKLGTTDSVAFQLLSSNQPPLLQLNWWQLMLCYGDSAHVSVGGRPLEIFAKSPAVDVERDFIFEYSSDDCKIQVQQNIHLLLEESNDGHAKSDTSNSSSHDSSTKNESNSDSKVLDILHKTADAMSIMDRIRHCSDKVIKRDDRSSLDIARCSLSDGLVDAFTTEEELSHHTRTLMHEIESAMEARSIIMANRKLSKLGFEHDLDCRPERVLLRDPLAGPTLKSNLFLRRSLQTQFVGGSRMTSKDFTTDFMPTLRSIVRCEQRRKDAKKRRRFLHFFDTIRVFPKQSEMNKLLQDFKVFEILQS